MVLRRGMVTTLLLNGGAKTYSQEGETQKMPFSNWSKRTKTIIGVASGIVLIAIVVVLVGTQTGLFGTASTSPPFGSFDTPIEGSTVRTQANESTEMVNEQEDRAVTAALTGPCM
jgi:hypothetical protein